MRDPTAQRAAEPASRGAHAGAVTWALGAPGVPEEALLEDGVPPRFPDDEIRDLLDHDAHEEGRVARPLQVLPLVPRLSGTEGRR